MEYRTPHTLKMSWCTYVIACGMRIPRAVQDVDVAQTRAYPNMDAQLQHEERRLIETTLAATHGRVSGPKGAAVRLGLRASTLEFRIQRLGINKFQFRRNPSQARTRLALSAGAGWGVAGGV